MASMTAQFDSLKPIDTYMVHIMACRQVGIWKCLLENGSHFVSALKCSNQIGMAAPYTTVYT